MRKSGTVFGILFISIFSWLGCSCKTSYGTIDDESGPAAVQATVLWRTEHRSTDLQPMVVRDGVVYFCQFGDETLAAVDPATGKCLWTLPMGSVCSDTTPAFLPDETMAFLHGMQCLIFTKEGKLLRRLGMQEKDIQKRAVGNFMYWNQRIYYQTRSQGLAYVSIDAESDILEPKVIYPAPSDDYEKVKWLPPLIVEGVLYSGVNPVWGEPGTFFAMDLATETVLWESRSKDPGTRISGLRAWSDWPPVYIDGKLIILDPIGFGIIDASTGKIDVERDAAYGGGYYSGGFFYKDCVYLTTGTTIDNPDSPNNVKAIDYRTGEALWMNSFPGSHGSNPVCHEGITYVLSQDCMRILDAHTGKLLAIADNVVGETWQLANIVVHGDTLIAKNQTGLFCVKMDFRTDGKGKLWRVR